MPETFSLPTPTSVISKSMLLKGINSHHGLLFSGQKRNIFTHRTLSDPWVSKKGDYNWWFCYFFFFFLVKTTPTSQHCLVTEGGSECYGSKIISGEKLKKSYCTVVRITDHENISTFRRIDLQRHTLSTSVFLDFIPQVWWGFFWYTRWLRLQSIQRHTLKMKHMA